MELKRHNYLELFPSGADGAAARHMSPLVTVTAECRGLKEHDRNAQRLRHTHKW